MHIFYINLRTRPDRREFMERQAERLGLAMERVEAITPADLSALDMAKASDAMSAGEVACSYSHRAVWRLMVEQGLPFALILEDDCALADRTPDLLDDPALLSGIDMLQLETHPSIGLLGRPTPTRATGISRRRMFSSCLGTCGYVITAEMARRCIDHPDLPTMDLGKFLFSREGPGFLYRHRIFQAFPAVATPVGELVPGSDLKRSDITPTRKKKKASRAGSIRRRTRVEKAAHSLRHAALAVQSFGLAQLVAARYVAIPFAGTSHLAETLPADLAPPR